MNTVFYLAGAVAVLSTALMLTRVEVVHALLYLVISLLAVAVVFFTLGAPFVGALEVLIYAGAIMVLFIFVIMMLNLGPQTAAQESKWLKPGIWAGPVILAAVLIAEVVWLLARAAPSRPAGISVAPADVGAALYGPYLIAVELASLLLLAAVVGVFHLGSRERPRREGG